MGALYQMYTKYRNGKPVAYRYGEPWVATQLYIEGGYKTEKEAMDAWFRYLKEKSDDGYEMSRVR